MKGCHLRKKHFMFEACMGNEISTITTTTEIRERPTEVAPSTRDGTHSAGITNLITILMIVESCRTRRKQIVLTNQKSYLMAMVRQMLFPVIILIVIA
jgi:hypothetical protein